MMWTGDAHLVEASLTGEVAAFTTLVDRYRDAVSGLAYHHLGSFDDAQDAAQETFVRAYIRLRQLRDPASFGPWLRAIAASVCAEMLRRKGNRLVSLDENITPETAPSTEEELERSAARIVVRQALAKLSDKVRLTTTLFYIDGYSHNEIAHFLEVPVNTVRSRLSRARKQLREEMTAMVSDVLHEEKPEAEAVRKAVEAAIERGYAAHRENDNATALQEFETALSQTDALPASPEQLKLKASALTAKANASVFYHGKQAAIKYYEQALAMLEQIGDKTEIARAMIHLGVIHSNAGQPDISKAYYEKALAIYEELDDASGRTSCHIWFASNAMFAKDAEKGKHHLEAAQRYAKTMDDPTWAAVSRAGLDLLSEVDHERFPTLMQWDQTCPVFKVEGSTIQTFGDSGSGTCNYPDDAPSCLHIGSVFWQISHLNPFLDTSKLVGDEWSGETFSYSHQRLHSRIKIASNTEQVTTPAGAFDHCLLLEYTTEESGLPDDGEQHRKDLNKRVLIGIRRAWFAPGVGLVQLFTHRGDDVEATIQLQEYEIIGGEGYLPFIIGNRWSYGWANLSEEYVAKEHYRVYSQQDDLWYTERYGYQYKK